MHGTFFVPAKPCAAVLLIGGSGGSEPSYAGEALACEEADALIPVELVPGAILIVAPGADHVWPSADMAPGLVETPG